MTIKFGDFIREQGQQDIHHLSRHIPFTVYSDRCGYCLFVLGFAKAYRQINDQSHTFFVYTFIALGVGAIGISIMKTENKKSEQYLTPEMTLINIVPEGVLCASGGEQEDGSEVPGI